MHTYICIYIDSIPESIPGGAPACRLCPQPTPPEFSARCFNRATRRFLPSNQFLVSGVVFSVGVCVCGLR